MMRTILIFWSAFWTLALGLIYINNLNTLERMKPDLRETSGRVLSERKYKYSASAQNPSGNPQEQWNYEGRIEYDAGKIFSYTGSAPAVVGGTVALYVSKSNPQKVYFKDRLEEKSSLPLFLCGWFFLALGPWLVALPLGLLRPSYPDDPNSESWRLQFIKTR